MTPVTYDESKTLRDQLDALIDVAEGIGYRDTNGTLLIQQATFYSFFNLAGAPALAVLSTGNAKVRYRACQENTVTYVGDKKVPQRILATVQVVRRYSPGLDPIQCDVTLRDYIAIIPTAPRYDDDLPF